MDDSARAVGSKRKIGLAEEMLGVQITKTPPIVTPTTVSNTTKTIDQPSCVGMYSTLYLSELDNEIERLLIAFSATKVTSTKM